MTELAHLAGKVALVTGGASGIGFGIATACAEAGMKLVIADVDEAALAAAADTLRAKGAEVIAGKLDVRDRAAWAVLVGQVDAQWGGIWLLCNNAGVSAHTELAEMTGEAWDWLIGINLTGVFNGIHAVVPGMIARGQGGHVVSTASMGGMAAIPGVPIGAYYAAKAGVIALAEKLRMEVADHGIGVSALCPGQVESRLQVTSAGSRPAGATGESHDDFTVGQPGVMPAREVGDLVLEGVLGNHAFIFTHPEMKPLVEGRSTALLAEFDRAAARGQS